MSKNLSKQNLLISKIKNDLNQGFMILGNYSSQIDIIRVWTSIEDIEFLIVATSSKRFKGTSEAFEIQSFGFSKNIKLNILIFKGKTEINYKYISSNFLEE